MMMIVVFSVGLASGHLKNAFPYPISRARRARAFFVASLFDNLAGTATAVAVVLLLVTLGFWLTNPDGRRHSPEEVITTILSLALSAPVAQAAMVPGFSQSKKTVTTKKKIIAGGFVLLWISVAFALERLVFPESNSVSILGWVAYLVAFALIQTAFRVYLRWYFSKKDLF